MSQSNSRRHQPSSIAMTRPAKASSNTQEHLDKLNHELENGEVFRVRQMLNNLAPAVIAHLLDSSPPKSREVLWRLVEKEHEAAVLNHLNEDLRANILRRLSPEELASLTAGMPTDDLADILQQLPNSVIDAVLGYMDAQDRQRLERVLAYAGDTAGGLLNTDTITVRRNHTLDVVLRYLRRHKELPAMTDSILVVDEHETLIGILPLRTLLISDPHLTVADVMTSDFDSIPVNMPAAEVARVFEHMDLISAAVIDEEGKLAGRITIDDVVDVIRDYGEHSLLNMAGLDEDTDTFAPVFKTARRRAIWLSINLVAAFIVASVINRFADTIDQVVALAVLMTIVANMGGVAGNQTLTLMIRSLALGQIGKTNAFWLMRRELAVASLNGLCLALIGASAAWLWFDDTTLGIVFAMAMIINLITAGLVGAFLPLLLKKLGIDPAIAGGVFLTTTSDITGFLAFLGLATLFY